MKIKHQELKIEAGKPFANCKLGREQYAEVLTQVVETYADGMVLAVDNAWGTGKTTFVKMWRQYLEDREFRTVYFNAWENDFDANALVAILAELKPQSNSDSDKYKTLLQKGGILAKNIVPAIAKAAAKVYLGVEAIDDLVEGVATGASEVLEKRINEFVEKKETIVKFRIALEAYIADKQSGSETTDSDGMDGNKPLIFFIDELDRCRPSYAVEVLEQLKHLFSVPGIVFVLSIDKEQLAHAVRGFYGSDLINSDEYLRRFIDLEYSIPKPSADKFCAYLFEYYEFGVFFKADVRMGISEFRSESDLFLKMATSLFDQSSATLRQQEKIFGLARLAIGAVRGRSHSYPDLFFLLTYLRVLQPENYQKIRKGSFDLDALYALVGNSPGELRIFMIALLLHSYCVQHRRAIGYRFLHGLDIQKKLTESERAANPDLIELFDNLERIQNNYQYGELHIRYLLDKIDLLESLQIK